MENARVLLISAGVILRILAATICAEKAKKQGRNNIGWFMFGFIVPLIALIWINLLKRKSTY